MVLLIYAMFLMKDMQDTDDLKTLAYGRIYYIFKKIFGEGYKKKL